MSDDSTAQNWFEVANLDEVASPALLIYPQRALGVPGKTLVAGGTPTFPFHARRPGVECSPGTCVLWDFGYSSRFPDLDFLQAALVLTRVISKPGARRLCLDLGQKAIASENPPPRVQFLNTQDPQMRDFASRDFS